MNRGAKTSPSIVLDTNVWYSAIVYGGIAEIVVLHCLKNYRVVASITLIEELIERLRNKANAPHRWLYHVRTTMSQHLLKVSAPDIPNIARDPKDNHILAAAEADGCEVIVSGDKDLLSLGTYKNIAILSPKEFADLLTLMS